MKVIIAGSRGITCPFVVNKVVSESGFHITEVVSGAARGVDRLGEIWAVINHVELSQWPADWEEFGKAAGLVRNAEMAGYADALIAIWDGKSTGTAHMISSMKRLGKPVHIYNTSLAKALPNALD